MENWEPLQIRLVWYVLAGFVLGFTTSTLWEWLYFRQFRLRVRQTLRYQQDVTSAWQATETVDVALDSVDEPRMPWVAPVYQSSGVLLESEREPATAYRQTVPLVQPAPFADLQTPRASAPPPLSTPRAVSTDVDDLTPAPLRAVPEPTPATPATSSPGAKAFVMPGISMPTPPRMAPVPFVATEPAAISPAPVGPAYNALPPVHGHPDDLTRIQGIGEAYKRRLYAAGIYTWQQVADSDAETLRTVTKAKPNARPEEWKVRAQELVIKHKRENATYEGPLPDDLTRIDGIGPSYADVLYKAGICTYEHLAAALPSELAEILPTPAIGNEFDFDRWIEQAVRLANVKQRNASVRR